MQKTSAKKPVKKTKRKPVIKKPSALHRVLRFLPAILIFAAAYSLYTTPTANTNKAKFDDNVLGYATSMSVSELFSATNTQRLQNGVASLALNSKLNSAAQAKANDMVARDYWAHTTPTGEEPWYFIAQAGYNYQTAGENLAYAFDTSSEVIDGWMTSMPHRQNLLNGSFKDVGFGFANSANFVGAGEQTVVVAMYGAQPSSPAPVASTQPSTSTPAPQTKSASPTVEPAPAAEPIQTTTEEPANEAKSEVATAPTTNSNKRSQSTNQVASTVSVRKIQVLTGGNARWSSTLLVAAICGMGILWTLQRGREIKRLMQAGEHFFMHHIHLDLTVAAFIALGLTLLQTTGTIR